MEENLGLYQRRALFALDVEYKEQRLLSKNHNVGFDSLKKLWDAGLAVTKREPFKPNLWRLTARGKALKDKLKGE